MRPTMLLTRIGALAAVGATLLGCGSSSVARLGARATPSSHRERVSAEIALSGAVLELPSPEPPIFSLFEPVADRTIMLVGDSTANCLGWGLRTLQLPHVHVDLEAKDGCQLLTDDCGADTWRGRAEELRAEETLVLLGGAFLYGVEADGVWQKACHPAWDARFASNLRKHLRDLVAPGTRVWALTIPYPVASYDKAEIRSQVDCVNASIKKVAAEVRGVSLLDLGERLCPKGVCEREVDGRELRPDGVHFAVDALGPISRWVTQEIRP